MSEDRPHRAGWYTAFGTAMSRPVSVGRAAGALTSSLPGQSSQERLRRAVRGRVVLVTGASSGIGKATAIRLGSAGAVVLLVARDAPRLDDVRATIEALGGTVRVYRCDLADLDAVDDLADEVVAEHGAVDVLINNAGISIRRRAELSRERFRDFERPMHVNYFAAIRLTMGLLPSMRAQRRGHVINVTSAAVQVRVARFSGYVASKLALEGWSDSVQAELVGDGIRFTNVRMPLVRTPMIEPTHAFAKLPSLSADEAADMIVRAVVHRPRRVGPAYGYLASLGAAMSPRGMDLVRSRADRRPPSLSALRGASSRPGGTRSRSTPQGQ
ncbi:MAG: SDR family NAD(P)-dependent oxidoreductase [Jatrophihabitans sp.]